MAHVPIPLSTNGSSIYHVIRALAKEQEAVGGGESIAFTATNRDVSLANIRTVGVDFNAVCPRGYFLRREMGVDLLLGRLGLARKFIPRLFSAIAPLVAVEQPDVLLLHEGHYATTALPAMRKALGPSGILLLYLHTPVSKSIGRRELGRLCSSADAVVAVSDHLAGTLRDRLGPGFERSIHTVRNGVCIERFSPAGNAYKGERKILFVGQVAPHKGVHLLGKAAVELFHRHGPVFRLQIVGSAHHQDTELSAYELELRDILRPLGDRVSYLPYVAQELLPALYREATVCCVPSDWDEPFGMVALEALACGTPVIASNRGGLPEAVSGVGLIVDVHDLDRFVGALERVLFDPEDRAALSVRARAAALSSSWAIRFRELEQVIEKVREGRRG